MLKQAILADVVATRKQKDRITEGRDHQLQANTADVGLNLTVNLFAELLVLFIIVSAWITDPLYEVSGVVFDVILKVDLSACLFLLALLAPPLPSLFIIIHQLFIIMMRAAGRTPLSYRSIAHLDDLEAQELANRLGLSPETRRARQKEENMAVRNGVLRRLQANQLNFTTQETKIITDFAPLTFQEDRFPKIPDQDRNKDIQNPFRTNEPNVTHSLKRIPSLIDDFLPDATEIERTKEDYCRVWFEKLALEAHAFALQQENYRKDEIINQLRAELEQKGLHFGHAPASQPHAPSHNKSGSHHPSFSIPGQQNPNASQQNNPHWAPVHPNRNFTIGQPRNF